MPIADYPPPLDQLLRLGEATAWGHRSIAEWPDYVGQFGLNAGHIPDLIRLLDDTEVSDTEGSDTEGSADGDENDVADPSAWAQLHAWRALGQLRATTAVGPLLDLLDQAEDDASFEEMPHVFGLIGPAALPLLRDHLAAHRHAYYHASASVLEGIRQIAEQHPAQRDEAVAILLHSLPSYADNDPTFNGFLIGELTDLQVTAALPLIEQAFAADKVDIMMTDWPTTQFQFGLISADELQARSVELTARRRAITAPMRAALDAVRDRLAASASPRKAAANPAKAKRKQVAASRKKNRPRK